MHVITHESPGLVGAALALKTPSVRWALPSGLYLKL